MVRRTAFSTGCVQFGSVYLARVDYLENDSCRAHRGDLDAAIYVSLYKT